MTNSAEGVDRGRVWRRTLSHSLRLDNVRYFATSALVSPQCRLGQNPGPKPATAYSHCLPAALGGESTLKASVRLIEVKSNPDCSSPSVECLLHGLKIALAARSLGEHAKPLTQRVGASEAH